MSGDLLSGDEIGDLLGALGVGPSEEETGAEVAGPPEENGPQINIYNYAKPELFTQPAFEIFYSAIEQAASEFSEFVKKETTADLNCSIDSINQLSLDEYQRSLPDYCFGLFTGLPGGGKAAVITNPLTSSGLSALFMNIPVDNVLGEDSMSCAPQIFRAVVRNFLSEKLSTPVNFRDIRTVPGIVFRSTFEIVFLASINIIFNDKFEGLIHAVFPFYTLVRLFPEAFIQYRKPLGSLSDSLAIDENGQRYDGAELFRRKLVFHLKGYSLDRIDRAIGEETITTEPMTRGQLVYTHEE